MIRSTRTFQKAAAVLVIPAAASFALAGGDKQYRDSSAAGAGATAASAQVASERSGERSSSQQNQQAPEGFVLIEERVVYLLGNQPQAHFLSAAQKLGANDKEGAAAELRIAANYIDMQGSRAGADKQHLDKASQKLNKLADKAKAGDITSPDQLSKAFSRANLALSKHFQSKAESALEKDNFVMAGYDLENAANSFRQAMVWSKQELKPEQVQAVDTAAQVALSLQAERMSAADEASSSQEQAQSEEGASLSDQAQQASASSSDPRIGTTPAEAQNIAQHAREAAKTLGEHIDQFAQASQDQQQDAMTDEARSASEKQAPQQE